MKKVIIIIGFSLLYIGFLKAQGATQISPSDKVYGLSKFWQEVNYNFIYLEQVDKKMWDSAYKAAIINVQNTKTNYAYYRELQKFCALLKDGHTNVYMPQGKEYRTMLNAFGDYAIYLQNIDGKAIIVRTNESKKLEIPIGSEVIEVNGMTTKKYMETAVMPFISSSTDYVLQDLSIKYLLEGLVGDSYTITIKKPNGETSVLALTHAEVMEKAVFPSFDEARKLLDFKWIDNKIAYVSLNSFENDKIVDSFKKILPELYNAKKIIIDLRYNGGGSSGIGKTILEYFTKDEWLYGSKSRSRNHIPTYKAWGTFMLPKDTIDNKSNALAYNVYRDKYYYNFEYTPEKNKANGQRITVPTVVLLGHHTASAAEDFLIYADNQKHITKIGSNSFGSTGQPYYFILPGGGRARVCTKEDLYPDGRKFVGIGIKPDIEVVPTIKDYIEKKDVVLEKAIQYLNNK